jgi:hypothetical protein
VNPARRKRHHRSSKPCAAGHVPDTFGRSCDETGVIFTAPMTQQEQRAAQQVLRGRYDLTSHRDRVPQPSERYGAGAVSSW